MIQLSCTLMPIQEALNGLSKFKNKAAGVGREKDREWGEIRD